MKNAMQKWISVITIPCLLTAVLTGCGSKVVTEVAQTVPSFRQGTSNGPMEAPQPSDIPEEDVQTLIRAGLDAASEESDLWEISEITDMEVFMQLMQGQGGGREHPEVESFDGEWPEMPDGENRERPDGTMPQLDGRNQEEGTFQEGDMPKNGQNRGEAGGRQPGNRGGMAGIALVISCAEGTTLAAEDIFAGIQITAEELGYQVSCMELTEDQQAFLDAAEECSAKMIVLIHTQMPEMRATAE